MNTDTKWRIVRFWFDTREKNIVQNTHLGKESCKQKMCDLIVI